MEGLFAVPLMWLGVPVYYAVPSATHFIFLFPFLFTAFYLFFKNQKPLAVAVLAVILCMPQGYDIMTSLPRGFVTCVFFGSFFIINILNPARKTALLFNMLMAVLGYFVSANSLIISLPFLFYMFLHHYRQRYFYVYAVICLLFFIPLYFLFDGFYKRHPSYVIYAFEHDFSVRYFIDNLLNPNRLLVHAGFFTEGNCITLIVILVLIAVVLFKISGKAFYSYLVFLAFFITTFSTGKSRDGVLWPWYSFSRLYVGLPFVICLSMVFMPLKSGRIIYVLVAVVFLFSAYKFVNFKKHLNYHTQQKLWTGVHLVSLKSALDGMNFYKESCKKNGVDFFLISNGFWLNTYLDYGGPAVFDDFPATEETNSERRYWVREGNRGKVIPKFLFLSGMYDFDKVLPPNIKFNLTRLDDYGLMLVTNNSLPMEEFINITKKAEGLN